MCSQAIQRGFILGAELGVSQMYDITTSQADLDASL